jgi:hypothetical protein
LVFTRQRGQVQVSLALVSTRCTSIPQCEQNLAPRKIMPKHSGQATVARRELQWSQRVASEETAAPQLGQFNDCAAMGEKFPGRAHLRKPGLRPTDYTIYRKLFFTASARAMMIRQRKAIYGFDGLS